MGKRKSDEASNNIFAERLSKTLQQMAELEGYDENGYNFLGYDKDGYDKNGFDKDGYNRDGYDINGFNREGINRDTTSFYDSNGYNQYGYDKDGYNKNGFDKKGYDKDGFNSSGLNKNGKTKEEVLEMKKQQKRNYFSLLNNAEKLAKGELSIEEYIRTSKTTLDELIQFAKKSKMSADVIKGLYKQQGPYKTYTTPFSKKKYLEITTLKVGDKTVKPTEQDVDKCIEYLKSQKAILCHKTISDTIRGYLNGEIDVTITSQSSEQGNNNLLNDSSLHESNHGTELERLEAEQKELEYKLNEVRRMKKEILKRDNNIGERDERK